MKYLLFLLCICCLILTACTKKGIEFDQQYIRGRVFLTDTTTGFIKNVPVPDKLVYLSKGDPLNYLYRVRTDKEGYFTFNLLSDENNAYTIYGYDTSSTGKVFYKGQTTANRGDKSVVLQLYLNPDNQNGVVLYAKDPQNAALPSVNFKLYNNQTLAQSNTSQGFISIQSDNSGKAYHLNLPAGDYWINAERTIDTFTYQRIAKKITVGATGFTLDTMMLFKKNIVNGLNLRTMDSLHAIIPGATVYLYNNESLARINSPSGVGSIGTSTADLFGFCNFNNLPEGNYFINARRQIDAVLYQRVAKRIFVGAAGIVADTIQLVRRMP